MHAVSKSVTRTIRSHVRYMSAKTTFDVRVHHLYCTVSLLACMGYRRKLCEKVVGYTIGVLNLFNMSSESPERRKSPKTPPRTPEQSENRRQALLNIRKKWKVDHNLRRYVLFVFLSSAIRRFDVAFGIQSQEKEEECGEGGERLFRDVSNSERY